MISVSRNKLLIGQKKRDLFR